MWNHLDIPAVEGENGTEPEVGSLDEADLIARAQRGEADAFEELVRRHQQAAFRVAYLITGSAAEAEDAAQDALVKAYLALSRFRTGAPLRPWLLTIVANEARNRRASARRRFTLPLLSAEATPSSERGPEEQALTSDRFQQLARAIHELRHEDRDVIACRYFLELSETEMTDVLGLPRGTIKSRLSRALGRLRLILAEEGGSHA